MQATPTLKRPPMPGPCLTTALCRAAKCGVAAARAWRALVCAAATASEAMVAAATVSAAVTATLAATALAAAPAAAAPAAAAASAPSTATTTANVAPSPRPVPTQVMVLGTYHFGNPGQDVHNARVDNVLTPRRQAELAAVARALLEFKPTHVMVEQESTLPGLAVASYQTFNDEALATRANEVVQIGFRVARLAGLTAVQGIDEQPAAGEPDYYPYDPVETTARELGQLPLLTAANAPVVAFVKTFEARQPTDSVARLLQAFNDDASNRFNHAPMYSMLAIGDTQRQAGAELNAMWYLRNAKIFAKLMGLVRPGDRVLVVFGAGHGYWLRHFARETPGFQLVPVGPYLARAQAMSAKPPAVAASAASSAARKARPAAAAP